MDDELQNLHFIDEKRVLRTLEAEVEAQNLPQKNNLGHSDFKNTASNPIKSALMKFVHLKNKFDIKDI